MEFFDSHAHYNDEKFNLDREEIISNIYKSGVTSFVCAGYSLQSSKQAIEIAKKYKFIYSTVGVSPNDIAADWKSDVEELDTILNENRNNKDAKIVAVGEIGLDYHYDIEKTLQKEAFIEQIKLANKYNLPIVIHTRDAIMDTLEILKENPVKNKGMFHCCPLNRELVKQALKMGFYISFAGPITFKNTKNANEIISNIPLNKILIETDSPYLSPEPNRGKRNDSRNVIYMAKKIAEIKQMDIEEVAKVTYQNALNAFNIK